MFISASTGQLMYWPVGPPVDAGRSYVGSPPGGCRFTKRLKVGRNSLSGFRAGPVAGGIRAVKAPRNFGWRATLQTSAGAYRVRRDVSYDMQFGGTVLHVDQVSLNAIL